MKLAAEKDNDSSVVPLNSPGGSTLQWDARRGLLYLAPFVLLTSYMLTQKRQIRDIFAVRKFIVDDLLTSAVSVC